MKIYVDFDEVIVDSEKWLFDGYEELHITTEAEKIKYIQNKDWKQILSKAEIINDAINILKGLKKDITILTKVHSMENEGVAKIKFLRSKGIESNIILVPYPFKKTEIVIAKNNILIDDTVHNLDDWFLDGGIPIYFNKDNLDIDGWNTQNKNYLKIKSLEYLKLL